MSRDCLTCKFADTMVDQNMKIDFTRKICRKGPPTPVFVPTPSGTQQATCFPVVQKGLWCYQWESNEEVAS